MHTREVQKHVARKFQASEVQVQANEVQQHTSGASVVPFLFLCADNGQEKKESIQDY